MSETKSEEKEVKIVLVPKTIINYTEAGGKRILSIIVVDKKGKLTKTHEVKDKAIATLKKFVNSL